MLWLRCGKRVRTPWNKSQRVGICPRGGERGSQATARKEGEDELKASPFFGLDSAFRVIIVLRHSD
jgi:hypothetical protein